MTVREPAALDEARLNAFVGQVMTDWGGAATTALALIGDRLGLYRAMADGLPLTSAEVADRSGTAERYVRDWLVNQAASGYVEYDAASDRYRLPAEHAAALTADGTPVFMAGGFQLITAMVRSVDEITDAFRTGAGFPWGGHHHDLFAGTERFFKPGYVGNLVGSWIPALDGVEAKLRRGASVADVGCGHGASTIVMAQAFPNSRFVGYDSHAPSIEAATRRAREAGVENRVRFEVSDAHDYPADGAGYDLICFFDCFHDLPDPEGGARRAHRCLHPDGTVMIVEPMAGDTVEGNLNPVGRIFSAASVLCCTPNALHGGKHALGTIATDAELGAAVAAGGFTRFRRATETPVNRVFEARP